MEIAGAPQLWADLKNAPGRFLAIDYDGTLAPFRIDRMQAFPVRGAREALERIIRLPATGAAVISGRPVREVSALLNLPGVTIIGSHGWEEQKPGQPTRPHPLTPIQTAGLECAKREAVRICGDGRVEAKTGSVAIHTRGMDESRAGKIRSEITAAWSGLEAGGGLEIRPFNGGLGLRCRRRIP
jgi:trehalose 6-phosphate phosphatase